MSSSPLSSLRDCVAALTDRARTPFSGSPAAAGLLLADGSWLPGVRVESASYALTLPALLNAYTAAVALDCAETIRAIVLSRPARRAERLYIDDISDGPYRTCGDDAWLHADEREDTLPDLTGQRPPFLSQTIPSEADGLRLCRTLADRAHVPASDFPVAALAETSTGGLVPGVNVEHPDWKHILCAERNALGTLQSYAAGPPERLFLSCRKDPNGTPCGACRQLLVELAPSSELWMDRHDETPERTRPSQLLPNSFRGRVLSSTSDSS